MEHEPGAYFTEHEDDDVVAFIVIEVNEDSEQYRVAERVRTETTRQREWYTYWISEKALADRMEKGACSFSRELNDKQLLGVLKLADVLHNYQELLA